jgi:hypothetical protein
MGPFLVGLLGLSCQYKRFSFCLGCSSRPCPKYCFPHCTLFQLLCPQRPARWAGSSTESPISQSVSLGIEERRTSPLSPSSQIERQLCYLYPLTQRTRLRIKQTRKITKMLLSSIVEQQQKQCKNKMFI